MVSLERPAAPTGAEPPPPDCDAPPLVKRAGIEPADRVTAPEAPVRARLFARFFTEAGVPPPATDAVSIIPGLQSLGLTDVLDGDDMEREDSEATRRERACVRVTSMASPALRDPSVG